MEIPNDSEQRQDEDHFRTVETELVLEPVEDPEEHPETDPEEDPMEDPDEEPDEEPEYEPMETRDVDTEEEDPSEEDPANPVPREDPTDDDVVWTDIPLHPQVVRDFPVSPPISPIALWSPIAIEDSEETIRDDTDAEIAPDSEPELPNNEPEMPAPPPIPAVSAIDHGIVVAQYTTELAVAYARMNELQLQLDAEKRARFRAYRHREMRDSADRRAERAVHRIERRALSQLRARSSPHTRRLHREDADRVVARAMARVRRVMRSRDD